MSSTVLELTGITFDEERTGSDIPVVAEFSAEWCPPCRAMAPLLHELAEAHEGRLRFVRVDADDHRELARRYEVVSVPTFLVFVDGEVRGRMVGARSRGQFLEEITRAVG